MPTNETTESPPDQVAEPRRGPGRPQIGTILKLRFPFDLIAEIDERRGAKGQGPVVASRSEMIRTLLREALAHTPKP